MTKEESAVLVLAQLAGDYHPDSWINDESDPWGNLIGPVVVDGYRVRVGERWQQTTTLQAVLYWLQRVT